ncbi:MAG TPA: HXXEE domain-containing protein [Vicinamibacterales bacterium]|jgi:hypothetical protein
MHPSSRDRMLGGSVVVAAALFQGLWLGRAAALISVAFLAAYAVWLWGAWSLGSPSLQATYVVAVAIFFVHACEEFLTGFQRRLPALVGDHWTDTQFLVFNATWFAAFVLAGWGLRRRRPLAVLIVLFLALGGGVGNGVAHLLLVVAQGGYFPGAWTAPLCLIVGTALLRQLFTVPATA